MMTDSNLTGTTGFGDGSAYSAGVSGTSGYLGFKRMRHPTPIQCMLNRIKKRRKKNKMAKISRKINRNK